MKRSMAIGGCVVLLAVVSGAQEGGRARPLPMAKEGKAPGVWRADEAATPAMRIASKQKMCDAEKAKVEEEMARLKDDPDMSMALAICNTALLSYSENLKAQADAIAAGDAGKLKELEAQEADLENACWRARNGAQITRSASENRRKAQSVPPAASPEGEAARSAYLAALTKLGDFYAEQAKHPSDSRSGPSPETREAESDLKLARDRARVEYEYQTDLAKTKARIEKQVDRPAQQALIDTLMAKITLARDAQIKLLEAQDAFERAQAARNEAEDAAGLTWEKTKGKGRGAEKKRRDLNR